MSDSMTTPINDAIELLRCGKGMAVKGLGHVAVEMADRIATLEAERDELQEKLEVLSGDGIPANRAALEGAMKRASEAEAERDEWKRRAEEAEYDAETARLIEERTIDVEGSPGGWTGLVRDWDKPMRVTGECCDTLGEAVRAAAAAGVGEGEG